MCSCVCLSICVRVSQFHLKYFIYFLPFRFHFSFAHKPVRGVLRVRAWHLPIPPFNKHGKIVCDYIHRVYHIIYVCHVDEIILICIMHRCGAALVARVFLYRCKTNTENISKHPLHHNHTHTLTYLSLYRLQKTTFDSSPMEEIASRQHI